MFTNKYNQPIINSKPPKGVTGPRKLKEKLIIGSILNKYIENDNMKNHHDS